MWQDKARVSWDGPILSRRRGILFFLHFFRKDSTALRYEGGNIWVDLRAGYGWVDTEGRVRLRDLVMVGWRMLRMHVLLFIAF